jgi:hypothetical protein
MIRNPQPPQAARIAADEVGGDAGFIDEHKLTRVVDRLRLDPAAAGRRDVRASLFVGVYGFF